MSDIEIDIKGADKIIEGLKKFPEEIKKNFQQAGQEAGTEIIQTRGIGVYPPETDANKPPTPYYIRGVGMQYKSKNNGKSENYGRSYYIKKTGAGAAIGNKASYAKWLTDEELQAKHMEKIGWRKIVEVAKEKMDSITAIYNKWADYTIRKLGL